MQSIDFSKDFEFFGLQNGDECYCGSNAFKLLPTRQTECNMPCSGNQTQSCGSSWRMNVYSNSLKSKGKTYKMISITDGLLY